MLETPVQNSNTPVRSSGFVGRVGLKSAGCGSADITENRRGRARRSRAAGGAGRACVLGRRLGGSQPGLPAQSSGGGLGGLHRREAQLHGAAFRSAKKRFGIVGPQSRKHSRSRWWSSGEHVVNVHLKSAADGFDQEQLCSLNLLVGKSGHAGDRDAAERDVVDIPMFSCGAGGKCRFGLPRLCAVDPTYGRGSTVSAGIGSIVQEFLRSRKAI